MKKSTAKKATVKKQTWHQLLVQLVLDGVFSNWKKTCHSLSTSRIERLDFTLDGHRMYITSKIPDDARADYETKLYTNGYLTSQWEALQLKYPKFKAPKEIETVAGIALQQEIRKDKQLLNKLLKISAPKLPQSTPAQVKAVDTPQVKLDKKKEMKRVMKAVAKSREKLAEKRAQRRTTRVTM